MKISAIIFLFFISLNDLFGQDTIKASICLSDKFSRLKIYYKNQEPIYKGYIHHLRMYNGRKLHIGIIHFDIIKENGKFKNEEFIHLTVARYNVLWPFQKNWQSVEFNYKKEKNLLIHQDRIFKKKYDLKPEWSNKGFIIL
jgi:hypothetical protein